MARGRLYRPCGASLSERWHCLQWLPEARRKQIVVLFSSSYSLHERAAGSKNHHCLLTHTRNKKKKKCFQHWLSGDESQVWIIVYSSSWSLLWSNRNNVPTWYFTWSKGRYTHCFWLFFLWWCQSLSGNGESVKTNQKKKKSSQSEMCIISNTRASICHWKESCIVSLHVSMKADREHLLWIERKYRELKLNSPTLCASSAQW